MAQTKKLRRRAVTIVVAFSILLFGGFGCKGLSAQQKAAVAPVTLEYWTVFDDVDALQKQIDDFHVARPYLTVNLKQLRPEELYPRLVEALAEDKGPDIISVPSKNLGMYQSKLAEMPPSVNDTIVTVTKTAVGTTDTTVAMQPHPLPTIGAIGNDFVQVVKKDAVRDGKIYGLPLSLDSMAIYYNKDLLDRSGVPTPPKTWEEFQADVKKITRVDKQTGKIIQSGVAFGSGANVPGVDDILYILFKQSGVNMTDKNGLAVFNKYSNNVGNSPAATVLDFYTDFANPTRDTYSWGEQSGSALEAFVSGQAGFFFGYNYHLAVIRARAPQLNIGIIPLLQLNPDARVNAANYWLQTVVAKSKHQNEAWDLVAFLTYSDATKKYLSDTGRPTALRSEIASQLQNPDLAPFATDLLVADNWYRGNNYDASLKALQDMIHDWLALPPNAERPELYRQDALDRAANKINQTF